jgi:hypothetical protein
MNERMTLGLIPVRVAGHFQGSFLNSTTWFREWKETRKSSRHLLNAGLAILLLADCVLGYAHRLSVRK